MLDNGAVTKFDGYPPFVNTKMMACLSHGLHIHLIRAAPVTARQMHQLDGAEQQKAARFMFAKDRELYAAAHVFLRTTLSRYAPLEPADWQFSTNPYGKPAVSNAGYQNLQFNLSHTHGLVAVAITLDRAVGVDVEQGSRKLDINSLGQRVFAPDELTQVLSTDGPSAQRHRFFTYWTLKEAYIKARGMGMSLPLKKFSFQPDTNNQWRLACAPELQDDGNRWLCQALSLTQDYFLAYVVEADIDPAAVQIHMPAGINNKKPGGVL